MNDNKRYGELVSKTLKELRVEVPIETLKVIPGKREEVLAEVPTWIRTFEKLMDEGQYGWHIFTEIFDVAETRKDYHILDNDGRILCKVPRFLIRRDLEPKPKDLKHFTHTFRNSYYPYEVVRRDDHTIDCEGVHASKRSFDKCRGSVGNSLQEIGRLQELARYVLKIGESKRYEYHEIYDSDCGVGTDHYEHSVSSQSLELFIL
jgi:hypothetical protein